MGDRTVDYDDTFGFDNFRDEIINGLGYETWQELIKDIDVPDIDAEAGCRCRNMVIFMERFDDLTDSEMANKILSRVRHGLKPSQSAWAREKFLKYDNLDDFIEDGIKKGIEDFDKLCREGKDFYGQPITKEVLDFIKQHPGMLSGVREGNKLYITGFPAYMEEYLKASDTRMKRYHACHCPFAKESILADRTVSSTICYCSLGHVKNYWEAVFDRELDGEVVTSVLKGDTLCTYVVYIPDDIMAAYVKQK